MLLGGTVTGNYTTPEEWGELLKKSGFKAITAPFTCLDSEKTINQYLQIIRENNVIFFVFAKLQALFSAICKINVNHGFLKQCLKNSQIDLHIINSAVMGMVFRWMSVG